jgi:hypothetical protein
MMSETQQQRTFLVEAGDYPEVLRKVDERSIAEAFIGLWPSRDAFGLHLLSDGSAEARLDALPLWLRPYVRFDGAAFAGDLEREGIYVLADVSRGVCVFDGPTVHKASS